jgi:hypothetical protein
LVPPLILRFLHLQSRLGADAFLPNLGCSLNGCGWLRTDWLQENPKRTPPRGTSICLLPSSSSSVHIKTDTISSAASSILPPSFPYSASCKLSFGIFERARLLPTTKIY